MEIMYMKIHETAKMRIVAVCDKDLIGKVLEDEGKCLDLDKYRSFYIGEDVEEARVKAALKEFGSANIVGKKAVDIALDLGLVEKEGIMYIKKIPYIQIYKI
jgi:hypothetical protein